MPNPHVTVMLDYDEIYGMRTDDRNGFAGLDHAVQIAKDEMRLMRDNGAPAPKTVTIEVTVGDG